MEEQKLSCRDAATHLAYALSGGNDPTFWWYCPRPEKTRLGTKTRDAMVMGVSADGHPMVLVRTDDGAMLKITIEDGSQDFHQIENEMKTQGNS